MLIEKKDIDSYLGMLPDLVMSQCMKQYGYQEDEWIVLPFININDCAMAINRRSETARKAVIMLAEDCKIVLKEIPWYCSSKEFTTYEIEFQKILSDLNYPIPNIYSTVEGQLFCTSNYNNKESYIFAQKFQDGESWKGNEKEYVSMAAALAKFHSGCYQVANKMVLYNPPKSNVFVLAKKMLDVAKQNIYETNVNVLEMEDYYRYASEKIRKYQEQALTLGYFDLVVPVHGDFNPWNLIFSQTGEVVAILDFDNSILDNPVHDLCEALVDVCYFEYKPNTTRFQGIPKKFDSAKAKLFLDIYKQNSGDALYSLVPCVSAVISIELIALAIARFDYNSSDIVQLYDVDNRVYNALKELVEEG